MSHIQHAITAVKGSFLLRRQSMLFFFFHSLYIDFYRTTRHNENPNNGAPIINHIEAPLLQ